MLPVLPAIVLACGQFFADPRLPRAVPWAYIAAILFGFGGYFPFIGFHL
jgi:hypothetical protein